MDVSASVFDLTDQGSFVKALEEYVAMIITTSDGSMIPVVSDPSLNESMEGPAEVPEAEGDDKSSSAVDSDQPGDAVGGINEEAPSSSRNLLEKPVDTFVNHTAMNMSLEGNESETKAKAKLPPTSLSLAEFFGGDEQHNGNGGQVVHHDPNEANESEMTTEESDQEEDVLGPRYRWNVPRNNSRNKNYRESDNDSDEQKEMVTSDPAPVPGPSSSLAARTQPASKPITRGKKLKDYEKYVLTGLKKHEGAHKAWQNRVKNNAKVAALRDQLDGNVQFEEISNLRAQNEILTVERNVLRAELNGKKREVGRLYLRIQQLEQMNNPRD